MTRFCRKTGADRAGRVIISHERAAAARATTMAFMTLALAQIAHLGNARSASPVLRLRGAGANPYAIGAVCLSVGLQIATMYVDPLPRLLNVTPLDARQWLVVVGFALLPALAGQGLKIWRPQP